MHCRIHDNNLTFIDNLCEKSDDEDTLAKKVLRLEHRIFPESLRKIASGKLIIKDNKVLDN